MAAAAAERDDDAHRCSVGSDDFVPSEEVTGEQHGTGGATAARRIYPWLRRKLRGAASAKNATRRLPILRWLPRYTAEDALGDVTAGVTVGLTVIPQSMAYAGLAGLPPQHGLYGSFVGAFIYAFVGGCKDVPVGPTAIVSLMTCGALQRLGPADAERYGPAYATLLCLLTGAVQLAMAACGLGVIVDFVSGPVASGFTSAVALLIVASQARDLLGVRGGGVGGGTGSSLWEMARSLYRDADDVSAADAAIGAGCVAFLLAVRALAEVRVGSADPARQTGAQRCANRTLRLVGSVRNSIAVVACTAASYAFISHRSAGQQQQPYQPPYRIVGAVPAGLPPLDAPRFSLHVRHANGTAETVGFLDMVSAMRSSVVVLPLVGLLENMSICKSFARGRTADATQELLAIGLCNVGNAFVHAYPGSGSFSRGAVNNASGVRTPLGGLYTAVLVVVALLFLTPCFHYIPRSCLAAVVVTAVVFMVEVRVVAPVYRSNKADLVPGLCTFVACLLLPLELGVLLGVALDVAAVLYRAARPEIAVREHRTRAGRRCLMLTPDRCLVFPSADYVHRVVAKHGLRRDPMPVVVDCSHVYGADFTAARVVEMLAKDFADRGQPLFFYNLKPSVVDVFRGVEPRHLVFYNHNSDLDRLLQDTAERRDAASGPPPRE